MAPVRAECTHVLCECSAPIALCSIARLLGFFAVFCILFGSIFEHVQKQSAYVGSCSCDSAAVAVEHADAVVLEAAGAFHFPVPAGDLALLVS